MGGCVEECISKEVGQAVGRVKVGLEVLKFWSGPHLLSVSSMPASEDTAFNKAECLPSGNS